MQYIYVFVYPKGFNIKINTILKTDILYLGLVINQEKLKKVGFLSQIQRRKII